jgi:ubiquinone biosynthesis UbiH/UbiF/VisC/COQ6 family hydroxylase
MNARVIPMRVDVAVIGRGAVGVATALGFARAGRSVAVVGPERAVILPEPGADNRVFALSSHSRRLLETLGVWQAIPPERLAAVTDMRVQPEGGRIDRSLDFSAYEARADALAWIVENSALNHALAQALGFSSIRRVDAALSTLTCGPRDPFARLQFDDGRSLEARLVVGADGARSSVRELARIGSRWRDYPQRALVANFDGEWPHRGIAWQWFGEHGILALLPLARGPQGEHRYSIVWSAPLALADQLQMLPPDALAARVEAVSAGVAGRLRLISRVESHPLRLGRVESLIAPRLALVGDAAHGIHPLAGQGMNLGFGDVVDLLAALATADDPGARLILRRYERARAEPVLSMQALTDGLQRLFDPQGLEGWQPFDRPIRALRDLGWDVIARSDWLRNRLIEQAAGRPTLGG